jgi:hypothetical protein
MFAEDIELLVRRDVWFERHAGPGVPVIQQITQSDQGLDQVPAGSDLAARGARLFGGRGGTRCFSAHKGSPEA